MFQAVAGKFLDTDCLHKIRHTQSATETSSSASGQCVIGANGVVTSGLRGVVADEDRTCIVNLRHIFFFNGNVFWRDTICEFHRLLSRAREQYSAVPGQ